MLPFTILVGWFYPLLGFMVLLCMFFGISIAFFKGKFWCSWLCPRGSFLDKIMPMFNLKKFDHSFMQSNLLRIMVLVFLMSMMGIKVYRAWPNLDDIGTVMVMLLTVTTLVAIILGTFLHPRTWCTVCPVGTISTWVTKSRNKKK